MVKKKLCAFTGSRADYSHLKPLMEAIRDSGAFSLRVLASGAHLSRELGLTYTEIVRDGFTINEKVKLPLGSGTPIDICKSMGVGLAGYGRAYQRMAPHAVIILGDRYEAFTAAAAAMIARLPIVHFNGGEATYGLIDEAIRHSITKMSYIHFTATEEYRRRVIQLGEDPNRVFCVGALSLDTLRRTPLLEKAGLEKALGISLKATTLAVTYHPVTLEDESAAAQFRHVLAAIDRLENTTIIFTKANADPNGRRINALIDAYVAGHRNKARAFASLGYKTYYSLLSHADAVVGNSSSGIIEAPSLGIPTVNIGDRQRGRIKAKSVLDCAPAASSIFRTLDTALSPEFRRMCRSVANPYGCGDASSRALAILEKQMNTINLKKEFYAPPGLCANSGLSRKKAHHG
jgi:GDP/UDP-N,N'-diacetylbacillosamine 2-epimerase (hydrolysing)